MSALTVIKFYCDDEIKRIPMNRSLGELTYDELCVIVQRVWKSKLSSDINNLILKYVDDEGDQICLESDIDISHALTFSTCLKVHVYDKETIPVNSKSLNLALEKKSIESIKKIVENSRNTLNKIIEQLEKIKVETTSVEDKNERELKPLSNAELSEFLNDQNDTVKSSTEEIASTPAVVDQTVSTAPPAVETSTTSNTVAGAPPADQTQTQSSTQYQGSLVQTPNSIHPTLTSQAPPQSNFTQSVTTPQLTQAPPSSSLTAQTFASPTTTYPPPQQTSQTNTTTTSSTMGATGNQSSYQKTNSYSSNMPTQPVSQASNTSSNMYASAPPPSYGTYATSNTKYGTSSSSSAPPPTSAPYPPSSNTPSTTNQSPYQRYPQTPTYSTSGSSVPPPPQSGTYGTPQGMPNPYGYTSGPYGTASSTAYGTNPYSNSYNSNQNTYSRPSNSYGQNKYY